MEANAILALAVFLGLPLGLFLLVRWARRRTRRQLLPDAGLAARVAELEAGYAELGRWADTVEARLRDRDRHLYGVQ